MAPKTSRESRTRRDSSASKGPRGAREARTAREARESQRSRRGRADGPVCRIRLGRRSLLLFGAGGLAAALGYVFLASGSITAGPILLVAGYCVFFPMGVLLGRGAEVRKRGE